MTKLGKSTYLCLEKLNQLVKEPNSAIILIKSPYNIALPPLPSHRSKDTSEYILQALRENIGKYSQLFRGILLGFQNHLILTSQCGLMYEDSPNSHHIIRAEFFVFRAEVGTVMKGIVDINEQMFDHVQCLVHETFNVSIHKPAGEEEWIGRNVWLGAEVSVEVIDRDYQTCCRGQPYIKGALRAILSEPESEPDDIDEVELEIPPEPDSDLDVIDVLTQEISDPQEEESPNVETRCFTRSNSG